MRGCCWAVVVFAAVLGACGAETLVASDWPQFQGPNRDGISPESGLATRWPETGPPVLWQVAVGQGYAGPVVVAGKVYLLDRVNNKEDVLRCLELDTGNEIFSIACAAPGSTPHNGSRMPVTVSGGRAYGVGVLGDCYCFDIERPGLVWRRDLPKDFKIDLTRPNESMWGMAQAPLLYKDKLIVGLQCADQSMAALDPATGATIWTSEQLGYQDYTIPALVTIDGREELVMAGGAKAHLRASPTGTIAGISLEDGSTLWSAQGLWSCYTPIAPAVALTENRFVLSGGYDAGTAMLQVQREGDGYCVSKLWHQEECGSHMHQPIVYGGYLYENTAENHHENGMVCISVETGEIMWSTKATTGARRFARGPMLIVDGLILNLNDVTGTLCLIRPTPEAYTELAAAKVLDGRDLWGYMAFSDGKLLLRNLTTMKCLDLRASTIEKATSAEK